MSERSTIMSWIRKHQLISFFVLAYALSWWPWPLYAAGLSPLPLPIFGPGVLLAALIMTARSQVWSGWRELGNRMIRWRVNWRWYAAALIVPLTVAVVAVALNIALGVPARSLTNLSSLAIFPLLLVLRLIDPTNGPLA